MHCLFIVTLVVQILQPLTFSHNHPKMKWSILLCLAFTFRSVISSTPCAFVTHSECGDDHGHLILETTAIHKDACDAICLALGNECHFVLFDHQAFARGNCRVYNEAFANYIVHCNQLAGPRDLEEQDDNQLAGLKKLDDNQLAGLKKLDDNQLTGRKKLDDGRPMEQDDICDFLNPPENSCQIHRRGNCDYGRPDESMLFNSWEICQAACNSISQCNIWQFSMEEGLCHIMYSEDRSCTWEFSPRYPHLDECDDSFSTTTTVPDPTTTTVPHPTTTAPDPTTTAATHPTSTSANQICVTPGPQKHGDWFCPPTPSTNNLTCHLECHPGHISDHRTVISCVEGVWSSLPTCVPGLALVTGNSNKPRNTVELYGESIHWSLKNLPDNRYFHSLQTTDSITLLCGGENTETSCLALAENQHWTPHSTTTSKRKLHTSVSILGDLHLLGGDSISSTEHLAPLTSTEWMSGLTLLERTESACAAKIQPEVYIVTGGHHDLSSAIAYNVTSGEATRLQDLNTPRYQHGCARVRDGVFQGVLVAGGWDRMAGHQRALSDSEIYDLSTGKWSMTGSLMRGRRGLSLTVVGNNILAMGGHETLTPLASVDKFNLTTRTWSATEKMKEARFHHAVALIPPGLLHI